MGRSVRNEYSGQETLLSFRLMSCTPLSMSVVKRLDYWRFWVRASDRKVTNWST